MNIKTALQSLIFLSIVAFVYLFIKSTFLKEQKDIVDLNQNKEKIIQEIETVKEEDNIIEDLSYISIDAKGNEYILKAEYGKERLINPNVIILEKVVGTIKLKNKSDIIINSDFAKYNSITYDTNFEMLRNEMIVSRATDNKAGAWVVAEAMRRVASSKKKPKAALYSVATVQEEIGLRGAKTSAYGIDPLIGIAVDVTWATDHPGIDKRKTGECVLGAGPVINRGANINPIVFDRLVSIAKNKKIPFQIMAEPGGTGTDANALQLSRDGVAAGLVSIPQRYMHTPVEIISLRDIDHCAQLLAFFVLNLENELFSRM